MKRKRTEMLSDTDSEKNPIIILPETDILSSSSLGNFFSNKVPLSLPTSSSSSFSNLDQGLEEKEDKNNATAVISDAGTNLFLSDAKKLTFDEKGEGIKADINNFSSFFILHQSYRSVLERSGGRDEDLDNSLKQVTNNRVSLKAIKDGELSLTTGEYALSVENASYFKVTKDTNRDEEKEEEDMQTYGRKKFHVNMAAENKEDYFKGCNIVIEILLRHHVLTFKVLNWTTYIDSPGWKGEQSGKNFTIYAARSPNRPWEQIIREIGHGLKSAGIQPGIQPFFDLPLILPYCSARNESDVDQIGKYQESDKQWAMLYDQLLATKITKIIKEKGVEKETLVLVEFKNTPDQRKSILNQVYMCTLSQVLLPKKTNQPTSLDLAITNLADQKKVIERRVKLSEFFSDPQKGGKVNLRRLGAIANRIERENLFKVDQPEILSSSTSSHTKELPKSIVTEVSHASSTDNSSSSSSCSSSSSSSLSSQGP